MKIGNRIFPYPILGKESDDYRGVEFSVELKEYNKTILGIEFKVEFLCTCSEIVDLIKENKAEYVLHVECSTTMYRKIFKSLHTNISVTIPINEIKGNVELLGLVILRKDIDNFSPKSLVEDFAGTAFSISRCSIIAYDNIGVLTISKNFEEFANTRSLFSICKSASKSDVAMDVDLNEDKIKIILDEQSYLAYSKYALNPYMQSVFSASVILPALIYVIEELTQEEQEDELKSKKWYISLKKNYQKLGKNIDDVLLDGKSFQIAQELLELPIIKCMTGISAMIENDREVDHE